MSTPTQDEIDDVLNKCAELADEGRSLYPGMSFEQGVEYAIKWMQGEGPHPLEE